VVRQYFMRDYNEEAAMLRALGAALSGFAHVVTYNGKMFDLPLLEARFRLNRVRFPLSEASHLDLLHPARRLWKLRLESCRLQSLESALLGVSRKGDIPGEEIPHAYFRYVRSRDPRAVGRIFEHNRVDIVSLAALLALACRWVDEAGADDSRDVFSLARVLERAQRFERSQRAYRRALELDPGPLRAPALMRLAAHARRDGDAAAAAGLWEQAAREGECTAFRELAVYHERRRKDAAAAMRVVESALSALAGRQQRCCRRASLEFERRRVRLGARLLRVTAEAQASSR
jgi:tetratricopeptide (TPR) repeat protein